MIVMMLTLTGPGMGSDVADARTSFVGLDVQLPDPTTHPICTKAITRVVRGGETSEGGCLLVGLDAEFVGSFIS